MSQAVIQLETLGCPSCMQKIENAVKGLDGVDKESVKVMFNASRVKVDFNDADVNIEAIEDSIEKLGYGVIRSRVKSA
ncbi:heavy-metal-associated domain-containing protein [Aliicoccus persicus]|uniref:Copper chaperone CopZ n=1 Tax=Aliicoccus persicus TaxID=930138 RepID=A0A662Z522_9STAP|nr:heavy-metal-associated domain-containing protein [Aliicoccus persicus]SEW12278.1 Copper chaperone CopZ [Aliicoccus persicus]